MGAISALFGNIFGSSTATSSIVDGVISGIDGLVYTDSEKVEDRMKENQQRVTNEILKKRVEAEVKKSYHPYRLTQRLIALSAWFTFLFVVQVGLYSILFGSGEIERIRLAIEFMNQMWMGEIVFAIISFYFGYDLKKKFDSCNGEKKDMGK